MGRKRWHPSLLRSPERDLGQLPLVLGDAGRRRKRGSNLVVYLLPYPSCSCSVVYGEGLRSSKGASSLAR